MEEDMATKIVQYPNKDIERAEDKKMALKKTDSQEASTNLTTLSKDIILLIADQLEPGCIVLLGITCHYFYSIFSEQIATIPLNAAIWTPSEGMMHVSRGGHVLELHQVLKLWNGLAGYQYFNGKDLDEQRYRLEDRTGPIMLPITPSNLPGLPGFYARFSYLEGVFQKRKNMEGLFFKWPPVNRDKLFVWNPRSKKQEFNFDFFMPAITPSLKLLEHQLNRHRRLRWSGQTMRCYAEWIELVGF
ncbi:hypothetical protein NHQ30_011192 [Ciborinia camelliae]|nr:hypothetical protein NHQ30_011192 [Ciborinia camelliae]